jgi:hypothetical protein
VCALTNKGLVDGNKSWEYPQDQYDCPNCDDPACDVVPLDLFGTHGTPPEENPWECNHGCRLHLESACIPESLSDEDALWYCWWWKDRNCEDPSTGFWEVYVDDTHESGLRMCHFNLRGEYRPYEGVTSENADDWLNVDAPLFGCNVNFVYHPPAHDGDNEGEAGCHWFIDAYCPGKSYSDFRIVLSNAADVNGAWVCALYPETNPPYPQDQVECVPHLRYSNGEDGDDSDDDGDDSGDDGGPTPGRRLGNKANSNLRSD